MRVDKHSDLATLIYGSGEQAERGFCALCALSRMSQRHWQTASYPPKEMHTNLSRECSQFRGRLMSMPRYKERL